VIDRVTLPGPELRIVRVDPADAADEPGGMPATTGTLAAWKAAAVYATAGLAYAVVLAVPWMVFGGGGFLPGRFIWLVSCYAWPAALGVSLVAAIGRRDRVLIAAAYFGLLALAGAFALARSPQATVGQLAFFWLFANAPGTLLLAAFLRRRLRAVGPLVFAFMAAAVTGAFLVVELARRSESALAAAVRVGSVLGMGAVGVLVLLHLVGFAAFGLLGWRLLGWIGRRYRARRFSDEALTLDAVWLLFAVAQSFTFAFESLAWMLTGPVAFVAFKVTAAAGFRSVVPGFRASGRALLVLRVFALGARSQRLFDVLAKRWLRTGPISLIAGPDLVTATVEPHEFLDFVGGRLSRQFVRDTADLDRRIAQLETGPDPDGRHRVSELFCHADTWQPTMRELAIRSDAVLMDLRSFSESNRGCVYELAQLLETVDLRRVVFVVDESTDTSLVERTLAELWRTTTTRSPNRRAPDPTVRVLATTGPSPHELRALVRMLFTAPPGVPEANTAPA
jgi:hypothetical protein